MCNIGRRQSPIDIISSKVKEKSSLLLRFKNYNQPCNIIAENNGESGNFYKN